MNLFVFRYFESTNTFFQKTGRPKEMSAPTRLLGEFFVSFEKLAPTFQLYCLKL